jgi:hypothetical protein
VARHYACEERKRIGVIDDDGHKLTDEATISFKYDDAVTVRSARKL